MSFSHPTSRRRFLLGSAALGALGAGTFTIAGLGRWTRAHRLVRRSLPLMGTLAELAVVTGDEVDEARAELALDAAFDELWRVERLMTRFETTSEVGRANLSAGSGTPVALDPRTRFVVEAARAWAESTAGRFDPCLGALEQLWDVTHRTVPPAPDELAAVWTKTPWQDLDLGADGLRIRSESGVRVALDLGGIAKGFAIDEARRALEEKGVRSALVNVGGDLVTMGTSEDGDPWKVGVRDPLDPGRLMATLEMADGAVATSGDYERYFDHRGHRYHHILGADGLPVACPGRHSLTISAPTCLEADAAATAGFGLAREDAQALIERIAPEARVRA